MMANGFNHGAIIVALRDHLDPFLGTQTIVRGNLYHAGHVYGADETKMWVTNEEGVSSTYPIADFARASIEIPDHA